ncbi:MAG: AbrB/MazE/SpoVT family DNA-binding domain-containing protein [Thiomonas sp.]
MTTTVQIRRQGGAAIVTIPAHLLRTLHIDVGTALDLSVENGVLTARPVQAQPRKRYSLQELLKGTSVQAMAELNAETAWALEGGPVGREIV